MRWARLRIKVTQLRSATGTLTRKSKETFAGDWCTTGDQFHVDEEGYYWYHGRTDDMLKVSGIFVAPAEIENCLLQHEAVLECAVVGNDAGDGLRQTEGLCGTPRGTNSQNRERKQPARFQC